MTKRRGVDEVICEILDFATIDDKALELARSRWIKLKGIRDSSFEVERKQGKRLDYSNRIIGDMFDGTIRLIDECEKLSDQVSLKPDNGSTSPSSRLTFVLDAGLFSDFAQIDSNPSYCLRGFDFLIDKISQAENFNADRDEDMIERNYFIALLGELFRMDFPIAITETGIGEISSLPSQFLRAIADRPKTDYQLERLDQAKRHAEHLSRDIEKANHRINTITKVFRLSEEERAERTHDAFSQISNSIAIPSSINNYVLARLNYALKTTKGNLGRIRSVASLNLRENGSSVDASDFDFVCRQLELNYRPQVNTARRSLEHAYQAYLKIYTGVDELGYGSIENVSALFEIHLLNCIFDKLGIEHSARYIHKNVNVFGFLRGFPRGRVSVPSLHPRFAFFFARPELLSERVRSGSDSFLPSENLHVVTTLVSSFESRIFSDEKISSREYQIFASKVQELLNQIQEMHCSMLIAAKEFEEETEIRRIQAKAAYDGLVEYFEEILNKCDQYRSEWASKKVNKARLKEISAVRTSITKCLNVLDQIGVQLEDSLLLTKVSLADQIQQAKTYKKNSAFSRTSILQMDECIEVLNSITQSNDEISSGRILVSIFRPKLENKPIRVNAIPLHGGYRYLFSLHSKKLARHILEVVGEGSVSIQSFCEQAISFCNENLPKQIVSSENIILLSCKYLVSAFQSANLRNWSLSLTLVETALGYIDDALISAVGQDRSDLTAQKVECMALQQITLRALSEETHSKARKKQFLQKSVSVLENGLRQIAEVKDSTYQVSTPLTAQSIRFYTSRLAVEVEKDLNVFRGIMPEDLALPWATWVAVAGNKLPDIDRAILQELETQSAKRPTRKKYRMLGSVAEQILKQCLDISRRIKDGEIAGHNAYMWEFVCLRTAQVLDFIRLVEFLNWESGRKNFADYRQYTQNTFVDLHEMQGNLVQRDRFRLLDDSDLANGLSDDWGLMAAVKFYYDICKELASDASKLPDVSRSSSWQKLQFACSSLVQTGLPRYMINELKDGIKSEILARSMASVKEASD